MRCRRDCAVTRIVRRRLASAGVRAAVVHSTSWREEGRAILLTHLAVIGRLADETARGFERRPVRPRELPRGTATAPPRRIVVEDVVEHALRHLAWLSADDLSIRAALDARWRESLRSYQPEPFCVFEGGRVSERPRPAACRCGRDCRCGIAPTGGTEACR